MPILNENWQIVSKQHKGAIPALTSEQQLKRLRWRCRRGTKELDMLLLGFLDNHFMQVKPELQEAFSALLDWQDPEIVDYLSRSSEAPNDAFEKLLFLLIN